MEYRRSTTLSVAAIGAVVIGGTLNAAHLAIVADPLKTFLVAALAGFAATMAGRAVTWRMRGE